MEVEGRKNYSLDIEGLVVTVRKDKKINLSPHIAGVLETHGIVEIPVIGDVQIKKMIMEEKRERLPIKLPEDFYWLLRFNIEKIDKDEKRIRTKALAKELIRERVEKICKLSHQKRRPKVNILPEETALLLNLSSMIGKYENQLLGDE